MPMIVAEVMFWAVSLVLIGSGAMKISQPDEFARFVTGASASNGRSSNPLAGSAVLLARITGVVEVGVGALALVNGGVVLGWVLGVMYLLFSGIIAYAIATGAPSCGCFGSMSSKPSVGHLLVNLGSSTVALAGAILSVRAVNEAIAADGPLVIAAAGVAVIFAGWLIFVLSGANRTILTGQSSKGRSTGSQSGQRH